VESTLHRRGKKMKGTIFDQFQAMDEELGFTKRKFRDI
jgi:hypothetical protein